MEPARDEREYGKQMELQAMQDEMPQWSPLGMSGNTLNRVL